MKWDICHEFCRCSEISSIVKVICSYWITLHPPLVGHIIHTEGGRLFYGCKTCFWQPERGFKDRKMCCPTVKCWIFARWRQSFTVIHHWLDGPRLVSLPWKWKQQLFNLFFCYQKKKKNPKTLTHTICVQLQQHFFKSSLSSAKSSILWPAAIFPKWRCVQLVTMETAACATDVFRQFISAQKRQCHLSIRRLAITTAMSL